MYRYVILISVVFLIGCKPSKEIADSGPIPEAFTAADAQIVGDSDGTYYGNSESAKSMAKIFSESMEPLVKKVFTGFKNRTFSMSGENFLTYCQHNEDSVVFLVHVPELKRYKGEVRDTLLRLAWLLANDVVSEHPNKDELEIAVGLRGSLFYGGTAVGTYAEEQPSYENEGIADKSVFYRFFRR